MRKCKGTGKAKGFGCGQEDNHYRYGLCLTKNHCFQNWLRNSEAGQEMLIKASNFGRKKVSAVRKKEESKDKRERRFELLSYPKRVQEARRVFQKWIRDRDKDLPCVSCGRRRLFYIDGIHPRLLFSFLRICRGRRLQSGMKPKKAKLKSTTKR